MWICIMPRGQRKSGPVLDEGPYEVEAIIDKRFSPQGNGTTVEYQVQWKAKKFKGRNTWEARENLLMGCEEMLNEFEEQLNRQNARCRNRSKRHRKFLTTVAATGEAAEISDWKISRDHLSTRENSTVMDVDDDIVVQKKAVTKKVWVVDTSEDSSSNDSIPLVTKRNEGTPSLMLGRHRKGVRSGGSASGIKREAVPEYQFNATTSAPESSRSQEQLSQVKPQEDALPFARVFSASTPEIFRCEGCKYHVNDVDTFIQHLRNQAHEKRADGRCIKCSGCPFTSSKPEKIRQHIQKYNLHYQSGTDLSYFFFRDM